ncbi:MAG: type III PLP-dependent enzyme [Sedimentisphaerales bacterium]|nr:type III PLP-dependent enzyme [Sedimentisphaerales bacterium]
MEKSKLLKLVKKNGSPLFIVDHEIIKQNYRRFQKALPRVQAYYAVKANSDPAIIKTLFNEGSSFDVASYNEFIEVYSLIDKWRERKKEFFIWDKIIFSNTIKDRDTLRKINKYGPLVTFDNPQEVLKIKENCKNAGLILRLKVPDSGSQVEMASKFGAEPGDASSLIKKTFDLGLKVEGLSFHVGSQCTNFENYISALSITSEIFHEARKKGYELDIIDIGGGFPALYDSNVPRFEKLAEILNKEFDRFFPEETEIIAEPGRYMVATSSTLVSEIIGKARRDNKIFYHINDGVYHTFSGVVFDHWIPNFHSFKGGKKEICAVVGQTCDSFDKISLAENLPGNLVIGDYLYTENIGAYSTASSTKFNGFEGAKILHINN